jgi:putative cell wall-binding protein
LRRLRPKEIIILGGDGVVTSAVATSLRTYTTGAVTRLGGASRYDTAVEISKATYPDGTNTVYIATGQNFPDALGAAPGAGRADAPLLLVPTSGAIPDR